jgi:hypothetical protein
VPHFSIPHPFVPSRSFPCSSKPSPIYSSTNITLLNALISEHSPTKGCRVQPPSHLSPLYTLTITIASPLFPQESHSFRDLTSSEISYSNNNLRELYLTSSLEPGFTWLPLMPWNVMQLLGVSNFGQGVLLAQGATEWASMATLGGSDARTAEMPRRTIMAVRCTVECGIG